MARSPLRPGAFTPRQMRLMAMLAAFSLAALLAFAGAVWAVGVIERQSARGIAGKFAEAGVDWAEISTDGLLVTLTGTAASEAERFRALSLAAGVVDAARVIDEMQVADAAALAPPRFSLEILRNDQEVSLIGLVPAAIGRDALRDRIRRAAGGGEVADMLEDADYAVPPGWEAAVDFGLAALALLPRSKISIDAERVAVTAITEGRDQRRRLETELARAAPAGLAVALELSAPRPVVTPFTLRFVIDERGARFDACAADTEAARDRILAAAAAAGVTGQVSCILGLGVPSPDWAAAAETAIGVLAGLGAGTVTFSDTDVSLIVPHTVAQEDFDAAVGRLDARLPEVFALSGTRLPALTPQNDADDGPVRFTATLSEEGAVTLSGILTDAQMRDAVQGLAKARFGTNAVEMSARLDETLPEGWPRRVMTGIEALAELHNGRVIVLPDRLEVQGRSGNPDIGDALAGLLADKLGRGQVFRIDVAYDERLDPVAMAPTPERCVQSIREILAERQITFDPGSARIDDAAAETLDAIAEALFECGELPLEIAGHTDSQGRAEMNLQLSQRRAEAVRDALAARRVLVSSIDALGYGATRPIADNATAEGREANRRIEFTLRVPPEPRDPADEADLEIPVAIAEEETVRPSPRPAGD